MRTKVFLISLVFSLASSLSFGGNVLRFQRFELKPAEILSGKSAGISMELSLDKNVVQNWILQFPTSPSIKQERALKKGGMLVLGYLPEDAYVVRGTSQQVEKFLSQSSFQKVTAITYPAAAKLSEEVSPVSVFNAEQTQTLLIKTFTIQDQKSLNQKFQNEKDIEVLEASQKNLLIILRSSRIKDLIQMVEIENIQVPVKMKTMEMDLGERFSDKDIEKEGDFSDATGFESGHLIIHSDLMWQQGYVGKTQIGSMADTGLDTGDVKNIHRDFVGAIPEGQYFGSFAKSWVDTMGHGTHVAGSIVGRGVASKGIVKGGAYEAQFIPQSMWSPMMNNLMVPSKLGDMFNKAYLKGARVHSNSWGAAQNFGSYDNYATQVDEFMFNNPDMLIVFAAGNSGVDKNKDGRIDENSMASPGTAKNALTVGASENREAKGGIQKTVSQLSVAKDNWPSEPIWSSKLSDNPEGLAMFSSRGPTKDGRIKPEIVAPGTNILSTRSSDPKAELLWGAYNKEYVWSGGTSMATPIVSSAALLTRELLLQKYNFQKPSAALVKAMLMNTAHDLFPGQYGEDGASKGQELLTRRPNSDEGYGRVDFDRMLTRDMQVVDEKSGLEQGASQTFDLTLGGNDKITINLVYTDAAGSANAATALVNDLDLELLDTQGKSLVQSASRINNHEIIEGQFPSGSYTVKVSATKVPKGVNGKQPFALVIGK